MTDRQKELILYSFNLACKKFWDAKKKIWKNRNWENEAVSQIIGMERVLNTMGYDIVWDSEDRYAVDIIERLEEGLIK